MKFHKNFLTFFHILVFFILISSSCNAENKERDLSTPLSRLMGQWDFIGYRYHFSQVDGSTMMGSFTITFPDKKTLLKITEKNMEGFRGSRMELDKKLKKIKEDIEKYAGLTLQRQYKVLSQLPDGAKIEIEFYWKSDDPYYGQNKVIYYIDKYGEQLLQARIVPYVGKIVLPIPIKYIDSKTSPANREKSIYGTYINGDKPSEYLELKSDGTFILRESGMSVWGEYEVMDDMLTLKAEIGLAGKAKIVGNMFIDEDDEVWVKKIN